MRAAKAVAGATCCLIMIGGLFLWYLWPKTQLLSPLADLEIDTSVDQAFNFSFFKTDLTVSFGQNVLAAETKLPEISATSAMVVDFDSGQILYQKNANERLLVASLVKMMTTVVALERGFLENPFVVSHKASVQPSRVMGLSSGERVSLRDLLYGLMLVSGNDAAVAIAEGLAGSTTRFTNWMNVKALTLGLKDTKFANPSGLDDDGQEQYSSAYDLAILTKYAVEQFPIISEIIKTREYTSLYQEGKHKAFILPNLVPLVGEMEEVVGGKDGYTEDAGLCLVILANRQNERIILVLFNSQTLKQDAQDLINFAFHQT